MRSSTVNIFIFIVGLVISAIAIVLLVKYYALKTDIRAIRATETTNITDLQQMQAKIARMLSVHGGNR